MDIRATLRAATDPQHRQLEAQPLLATLLAVPVLPGAVLRVAQALGAYHAAAAAQVAPWRAALDYSPFPHAEVLAADARLLGGAPVPSSAWPAVPVYDSPAAALGYLYVAEGSLLGNRLIARHLAMHLPDYHQRGGAYYRDAPERIAAHWRPLLARLAALEGDSAAVAAVVTAARDTFSSIDHWLTTFQQDMPVSATESFAFS